MILNLPQELHENIYQRLNARDRVKMHLALPKAAKLYNKERDKGLALVSNFIKKNKIKILENKSNIKPNILQYLMKYKNDIKVQKHCRKLGICTDDNVDESVFDIVSAIKSNNVSVETKYIWPTKDSYVMYAVYQSCKPETFVNLYKNIHVRDSFIKLLRERMNCIMFNLINYMNIELLHFIVRNDFEFKSLIQENIDRSLRYINHYDSLYLYNSLQLEIVAKYVLISKDNVCKLIEYAEENLCVSSWEFLQKYLKIHYT